MHNFGFPRGEMRFVIQDGIFFFLKKEFLDQLLYTDNKLFLSQIVNVPYTYKLIDLYFSRPTSLWKLTNVRRGVLLFEHSKKTNINSKCFSYQDTLHDCNVMATESGNLC
jgi:hypothetical protein